MSSTINVTALSFVRHNNKDYKPGDKIPGLKKDDLERLETFGAVKVEVLLKEPPPPPPKEPGGEDDNQDPPDGENDQEPPKNPGDPPKDPDLEKDDKKGKK